MAKEVVRLNARIPKKVYDDLLLLADKENSNVSDVVRGFIEAGLYQQEYYRHEEKALENMKQALSEILDPAVNRLAAISVKGGITSAASYFLSATALTAFVHPEIRTEFNEAITNAKKMGVAYMRLKDQSVSDYLEDNVKQMKKKYVKEN